MTLKQESGAVSLQVKVILYIVVCLLYFVIFDVFTLSSLYGTIRNTGIPAWHLNDIQRALFSIFTLKVFALVFLIGFSIGFGYWALKPYLPKKTRHRKQPE